MISFINQPSQSMNLFYQGSKKIKEPLDRSLSNSILFSSDLPKGPEQENVNHPKKTKPWKTLFFTLASLILPVQSLGQNAPQVTVNKPEIPVLLQSNHQLISNTCPDDGKRPALVDDKLRGLSRISAEQVALTDYLELRTARIQIEIPVGPFDFSVAKRTEIKLGTGFVCQEDGVIITNNHIIATTLPYGGRITVELNHKLYNAKIIAKDPLADIAVLKIETQGEKLPTFHFADEIKKGEFLALMGQASGFENVIDFGNVSALYQPPINKVAYLPVHMTNAPVNLGNSGGAASNLRGEMIGHIFAKSSNITVENEAFLMPKEYLESALLRLKEGKSIDNRLSLGEHSLPHFILVKSSEEEIEERYKKVSDQNRLKIAFNASLKASSLMGNSFGVSVLNLSLIDDRGRSAISGRSPNFLHIGDVIIAVNGKPFNSQPEFQAQIKSIFYDEAFQLTVIRTKGNKESEKIVLDFPAS